jgi:hypothetical protein
MELVFGSGYGQGAVAESGFSGGDVATAATVNVMGEWWERKRRRENK